MRLETYIAFFGGAAAMRLVELAIAWIKEKREQRAHKILMDQAATAIDSDVVTDMETVAQGKTALVKIVSLGSLPVTIKDGNIRVESSQYEKPVESVSLAGRKISNSAPITKSIFVKNGILYPQGISAPDIKLIVELACKSGESYSQTYYYDRTSKKYVRG
jgi:hypothetical protein